MTLSDGYSAQDTATTEFYTGVELNIWFHDSESIEHNLFDSIQPITVVFYAGTSTSPVTGLTTCVAYDSTLQYFDDFRGLTELGSGNYSFTIPAETFLNGQHTLYITVQHDGVEISAHKTFYIEEHNISVELTSDYISNPVQSDDFVVSDADSLIALVSLGDTTEKSASGNTIGIANNLFDNRIYTVFTRGTADSNMVKRMDFVRRNTFKDYTEPSFGYELNDDYEVNIKLNTSRYNIISNYTVLTGIYNLVIRNEGYDSLTGKTDISITPL